MSLLIKLINFINVTVVCVHVVNGRVFALTNTLLKKESMTVHILFFGICYIELVLDLI